MKILSAALIFVVGADIIVIVNGEFMVDLFPHLSNNLEAQRKAKEALDKRDNADYRCYMQLKELLNHIDDKQLRKLLANYMDDGDIEILILDALDAIADREDANEEFLRVMSGRD